MSSRVIVRLHDIADEIAQIRNATAAITFDDFERRWVILRAVQHGLLIIGEAAKNLPPEVTAKHPDIPWRRMIALGNFLRHEYATIDNRLIWDIVVNHLPMLDLSIRDLLAEADEL